MKLSRRQFLKVTGVGIGTGLLGNQVLPPFISAQVATFPSPVDVGERNDSQVLFRLEATAQQVELAGQRTQLLTYNGSFPGPTLRMREGDTVRVEFTNSLAEETNLHFHGLHVPMTQVNSETPFRRAAPGETILYEFPIPEGSAGTYWYHPHVHGAVAPQLFGGLAGAIVVEGPMDAVFAEVPEQLVILKDFDFQSGGVPEHSRMDWMMGREGKVLTVNGAELPRLELPDGVARLRLINASNARYYRLALPDAKLTVIGSDGGYVAAPYPISELLMTPGERYDVVARFDRAGSFSLSTLPYNRAPEEMMDMGGMEENSEVASGGMDGMNMGDHSSMGGTSGAERQDSGAGMSMGDMNMGGMDMESMMQTGVSELTPLLRLEATSPSDYRVPTDLRPIKLLTLEDASERRRVTLSENMMELSFLIDGKSFDMNRVDFAPTLGSVEHWQLVNETGMDHPMHLHVFPFQVYARDGVREQELAWKDVVNVAAGETVDILIPFEDFEGRTVFHCHVVEHEDLGMMSIVEVRPADG